MAVTFLPGQLANGRLQVQVAFGADLAADEATWTWTDITADVRHRNPIRLKVGRGDEATTAQPATATMTLDNRAGRYSLGGQCPNWPNIRRNVPVRVRVSLDGGGSWSTRFFGYATGWTPMWDAEGGDATTELEAAGVTRRLAQGTAPVLSTLRRSVLARAAGGAGIRAYWPCEDPKGATSISSGLPGGPVMTISSLADVPYPKWQANSDDFLCSAPLPEVGKTAWAGAVPAHPTTGQVQVRMLIGIPDDGAAPTEQTLFSVYTSGTITRWDIRYIPGGNLRINGYDTSGAVITGSSVGFNSNDTRRRYSLELTQDGADIDVLLAVTSVETFSGGTGFISTTYTGQTLGRATAVVVNPDQVLDSVVFGHISVEDTVSPINVDQADFNARLGESTNARLQRLCGDADVPLLVLGVGSSSMGPQSVAQLLPLLREVETTTGGVLHDGLHAGLTFVTYGARASEPAALVLDAAGGDLATALEPIDDDQATRNKITAKSLRGGEVTVEDVDGPLGTANVGVYDTSFDISAFYDTNVESQAGHRLSLGTVEGYRHPRLRLNLARTPGLADDWLGITLASRIDVTGISTIRPQHPAGDVSLIVEGWTEDIHQLRWDVTANCAPYEPWRIGLVAAASGDSGEFVLRAADDGSSTLAAGAAAGATSLSVATVAGSPLWSTAADDLPLQIEVGGIVVTVTAVAGASSPQTFTVTGSTVTKALSSGLQVALHRANRVSV